MLTSWRRGEVALVEFETRDCMSFASNCGREYRNMTLDDFRASLDATDPPAGLTHALAGLWWDGKGDWKRALEAETNSSGGRGLSNASLQGLRVLNVGNSGRSLAEIKDQTPEQDKG